MAFLTSGDGLASWVRKLFIELTVVRVLKSALRSCSRRSWTASVAPTFSLLAEIKRKHRPLTSKIDIKNTATRVAAMRISGSVNPALADSWLASNIGYLGSAHSRFGIAISKLHSLHNQRLARRSLPDEYASSVPEST